MPPPAIAVFSMKSTVPPISALDDKSDIPPPSFLSNTLVPTSDMGNLKLNIAPCLKFFALLPKKVLRLQEMY